MIDMGLVPPEGAEQEAQDLLLSRSSTEEEEEKEDAGDHPTAADDAEEPPEAVGLIGHFEASRLLAQKGREGVFVGSLDMSMTERELVSTEEGVGKVVGLFCSCLIFAALHRMVAVIRKTRVCVVSSWCRCSCNLDTVAVNDVCLQVACGVLALVLSNCVSEAPVQLGQQRCRYSFENRCPACLWRLFPICVSQGTRACVCSLEQLARLLLIPAACLRALAQKQSSLEVEHSNRALVPLAAGDALYYLLRRYYYCCKRANGLRQTLGDCEGDHHVFAFRVWPSLLVPHACRFSTTW